MRARAHRFRPCAAAAAAALAAAALAATPAAADRLKDLADVHGVRDNQLTGYGLVVGLQGTGDDQSVSFTVQSVVSMLRRMGVRVDPRALRLKNVAAVAVTATLPPFARTGARLDATVSSIGNARSLQGGTLLATPLRGADRSVYSVAQGPLSIGGFDAAGATGSGTRKNHATVGSVPGGAIVEREVAVDLAGAEVEVSLRDPDFTTAARLAAAIDQALGEGTATARDAGTVTVRVPEPQRAQPVAFLAALEAVAVQPDAPARVVISERTGTVVVGSEVRVLPCAVAQGGLTVRIRESLLPSQPPPLSRRGETLVVPETEVQVEEGQGRLALLESGATLAEVVSALNALGASPRDLVAIFQAMKAAGALRAELEVR